MLIKNIWIILKPLPMLKKHLRILLCDYRADGFLVFNKDDKNIPKIENPKFKVKDYS